MKIFEEKRIGKSDNGLVNIVFHSPLALKKADHEGLAFGAFSRQGKKIVVAVAVPMAVVELSEPEIVRYLHATIREAADNGVMEMSSRGVKVSLDGIRTFIEWALEGNGA